MPSPTTPTHGKMGAIYRLRPNNFKGSGLNDATLGTGFSGGGTSAHFEIVIDGTGAPDTFKWRKNGGAWTTTVAITGAAQTLSDSQTITFAATTGHTVDDQWSIGNHDATPTTESGASAQITSSQAQVCNPNVPPVWTDDGGANLLTVNYTNGTAVFDENVGNVSVSGNNGYILRSGLQLVGYMVGWEFSLEVNLNDITSLGDTFEDQIGGIASGSGSADGYYIATDSFFDAYLITAAGTMDYYYLELFNYDPDGDATGDHYKFWVTLQNINVNAPVGEVVKEKISFKVAGLPSFTANT